MSLSASEVKTLAISKNRRIVTVVTKLSFLCDNRRRTVDFLFRRKGVRPPVNMHSQNSRRPPEKRFSGLF